MHAPMTPPPPPPLDDLLRQAETHATGDVHLGLSRTLQLLEALGHPEQGLSIIHVAGTNGKGSVIAFLDAILRRAGYRVGRYTSPHLHRFNERIQIDQIPVDDATLAPILTTILSLCRQASIPASFFEITTVAAFCFFHQQELSRHGKKPGIVLLETGLGGRLDATNVITPQVSLITAIDRDHETFLGNTIAQISHEKAGILKPHVPAAAAPLHPIAAQVIRARARALGTDLSLWGESFHLQRSSPPGTPWYYVDRWGRLTLPPPGLPGAHQYLNSALAIAGLRLLAAQGWNIPKRAIQEGIASARWPGRLETFPGSPPLLLDGAHNPHAIRSLTHYLRSLPPAGPPTTLLFSALRQKNIPAMIDLLSPVVGPVWTLAVGGNRGMPADQLAQYWRNTGHHPVETAPTPEAALRAARSHTPPKGRILVTGSLYLVGRIRSLL